MQKKLINVLLIIIILITVTGCGKKKELEPNVDQLKEISDLITLEAEYHNVAKIEVEKGTGFIHLGEINRQMWVEYTGVIKIGINADDIKMNINGEKVKIEMPKPSILFINYKDYTKNSYYKNKDSWFNKNEIDYKKINNAIKVANDNMVKEVNKNKKLFDEAENNLEVLMENYINNISKINGIEYKIEFVYI